MSANFDRMIKSFMKSIKKQIDEKPKGYDTPAKVVRIQDGIAWVHIDGGVDETPVKLTVNAKKGDTVQVRLSNGTGFIVGNVSAPPTDDTKAIDAQQTASGARADALKAQQDALNAKIASDQNAIDMAQAVVAINADIEDLQSQIDGNITSWFYDTDPAMNKPPVTVDPIHPEDTGWDTDEKKQNHVGDLYYNVDSGDSWRFVYIDGAYSWTAITDSAATKALAIASQAQDTADSKRRVFIAQPTPPYDVGDLWMQGASGDIMTCTTPKASGGVYALSDWTKLNAYTDDTRANAAYTLASTAQTAANGKNKVYYTASAPTGGTYNDGDIWFNTSNGYQMSLYVENIGWVAEQFGNAAIADLSITNAKIANATIQSAKIQGLDVGKLTGGYIDAGHINAGSLTIGMSQVTNLTTTLDGKADDSAIPTKVSDLDNDSSFATTTQVTSAKNQAISAAASDATTKANAAQAAAISTASSDATSKANAAQTAAINTASADATDKANAAQSAAVATAASDATSKANAAAKTATNYITAIDNNGIRVHASNNPTNNYSRINVDGMQVYKGGVEVAVFGESARLGKTSSKNLVVDSNGIHGYNNTTKEIGISLSNGFEIKKEINDCKSRLYTNVVSGRATYIVEASGGTNKSVGCEANAMSSGSNTISLYATKGTAEAFIQILADTSGEIYVNNGKYYGLLDDFVIAQGTSGPWRYRKWASGKIEAWFEGSLTVSSTTSRGNVHYSNYTLSIPSGIFSSAPYLNIGNNANTDNVIAINGSATSATAISGKIWRPLSSTTQLTIQIRIYAWGS